MSKKLPETLSREDYALSILGQGPAIEITPMQGALISQAAFNSGVMVKPVSLKGEKVAEKRVMDERTAKSMRRSMESTIQKGTSRSLNQFINLIIGGKTGTAERTIKGGGKVNIAWMIGYLHDPKRQDKAPPAFSVVVENSSKQTAEQCTPIVRKVITQHFKSRESKR